MRENTSSDPLPFAQLHRSVKPKAARLASAIGVTNQHAIGSLSEFWDINGDPRELEELVLSGKNSVVLTPEQAVLRFRIASGKDVEPALLVELGFLEAVEEGFRVRGMSRFIEPIRDRLAKRKAGQLGGQASVKARKAQNGTAQPRSAPLQTLIEQPVSTPEPAIEASPKQPRSSAEPQTEARPNPEKRDESLDSLKPTAVKPPKAPKKPPEPSRPGWQALIDAMTIEFQSVRGESYDWHHGASRGQLKALRERHSDEDILRRWSRGLRGTYDRKVSAVEQLGNAAKWHALATDEERKPSDSAIADHTGFAPRWEGVYTEELPPYDPLNPLGEVPS